MSKIHIIIHDEGSARDWRRGQPGRARRAHRDMDAAPGHRREGGRRPFGPGDRMDAGEGHGAWRRGRWGEDAGRGRHGHGRCAPVAAERPQQAAAGGLSEERLARLVRREVRRALRRAEQGGYL